jgi:hypothetical protein
LFDYHHFVLIDEVHEEHAIVPQTASASCCTLINFIWTCYGQGSLAFAPTNMYLWNVSTKLGIALVHGHCHESTERVLQNMFENKPRVRDINVSHYYTIETASSVVQMGETGQYALARKTTNSRSYRCSELE